MNHTQRQYALNRLTDIYKEKTNKLEEVSTTKAKTLTSQEKVALIRKGKIKVLPDAKINFNTYFDLDNAFDFSSHEKEEIISKNFESKLALLKERYDSVRDEVMLGDEVAALIKIKSFTNFKV